MSDANLRDPSEIDRAPLDRVREAVTDLIRRTTPGGSHAGYKHRGEVSSRCQWLLAALTQLEADIAGITVPPPRTIADPGFEPTEAEAREIAAGIAAERARRVTAIHREQDEYRV